MRLHSNNLWTGTKEVALNQLQTWVHASRVPLSRSHPCNPHGGFRCDVLIFGTWRSLLLRFRCRVNKQPERLQSQRGKGTILVSCTCALSVPTPAGIGECVSGAGREGGWGECRYLRHFVKGQQSSGAVVCACSGIKVQPVRQIGPVRRRVGGEGGGGRKETCYVMTHCIHTCPGYISEHVTYPAVRRNQCVSGDLIGAQSLGSHAFFVERFCFVVFLNSPANYVISFVVNAKADADAVLAESTVVITAIPITGCWTWTSVASTDTCWNTTWAVVSRNCMYLLFPL